MIGRAISDTARELDDGGGNDFFGGSGSTSAAAGALMAQDEGLSEQLDERNQQEGDEGEQSEAEEDSTEQTRSGVELRGGDAREDDVLIEYSGLEEDAEGVVDTVGVSAESKEGEEDQQVPSEAPSGSSITESSIRRRVVSRGAER
jgi:hypothetical protein